MVLFLFVIMLMNLNSDAEPAKNIYLKFAGVIAGMCLFIVVVAAMAESSDINVSLTKGTDIGLIRNLGKSLFTTYVIPFEISSILFLSAMVGAVVIGKKDEEKNL